MLSNNTNWKSIINIYIYFLIGYSSTIKNVAIWFVNVENEGISRDIESPSESTVVIPVLHLQTSDFA